MAATIVKTTAKLLIGGGAVYATAAQGVWSNTAEGSEAASKIKTAVLPEQQPAEIKTADIDRQNDFIGKWNYGVQKVFTGIAEAPDTVTEYSKKAVTDIKLKLS